MHWYVNRNWANWIFLVKIVLKNKFWWECFAKIWKRMTYFTYYNEVSMQYHKYAKILEYWNSCFRNTVCSEGHLQPRSLFDSQALAKALYTMIVCSTTNSHVFNVSFWEFPVIPESSFAQLLILLRLTRYKSRSCLGNVKALKKRFANTFQSNVDLRGKIL